MLPCLLTCFCSCAEKRGKLPKKLKLFFNCIVKFHWRNKQISIIKERHGGESFSPLQMSMSISLVLRNREHTWVQTSYFVSNCSERVDVHWLLAVTCCFPWQLHEVIFRLISICKLTALCWCRKVIIWVKVKLIWVFRVWERNTKTLETSAWFIFCMTN